MSPETLSEKIERVLRDRIELVEYDSTWPELFEQERQHLLDCLPSGMIRRIEHYGSTSIPGMTAKPIVDMLVEVTDLNAAREQAIPLLEEQGYDGFWRPQEKGRTPRHYPWFIKRDQSGQRTHHIHMTLAESTLWEGLVFRDHLIAHPEVAAEYNRLKSDLAQRHTGDRIAYTKGKTLFVRKIVALALGKDS